MGLKDLWSMVVWSFATQMSAPESGRACTIACPFREDMWTLIVGAGSYKSEGGVWWLPWLVSLRQLVLQV